MQSFLHATRRIQYVSVASLRHYTPNATLFQPTALHRAIEASDLEKHPESGVTQEKQADVKHNHHWTEANATTSEAEVSRTP